MPQNTDNHAFYLTQIHQLKELQKLDDQIYEVQQILEKAPDELRDLQDKLTKAEVQRDRTSRNRKAVSPARGKKTASASRRARASL